MTSSAFPSVRRSLAVPAFPAFVLVVAAQLWLRPRPWVHEWYWTIDVHNFTTILLAPLVAGIAAWAGAEWSATADWAASLGRSMRVVRGAVLPIAVLSSVVYTGSLVVAGAMTSTAGTPGLPSISELVAALPALAAIWLATAVGFAAGWVARKPLVAPVVALTLFGVLFAGYTVLPEQWFRIGGATSSLLALAPRTGLQLLQVLFYVAMGAASLQIAVHYTSRHQEARWITVTLAAGCAGLLLAIGGMRFVETPPKLRCAGSAPRICLGNGYDHLRAGTRQTLGGPFRKLAAAGFSPPATVTQDVLDVQPNVVRIGTEVPTLDDARNLLVFAIIPEDCDVFRDEGTYSRYITVWYWVGSLLGMESGVIPNVDPVVSEGDSAQSRAVVKSIAVELATCHATG